MKTINRGISVSLALITIIIGSLMPFRCYADEQNTEGYEACDYLLEGGSAPPGMCDYEKNEEDAYATVSKVLDTVYLWVGIIAVLFVIIGGINYSISQGDPNNVFCPRRT